jgi:eukaryotic-like serine/threonine-protein kinase
MVKGKIGYMPLEQAVGGDIDRRADVFAVGVMLFEAVSGRRLWKGCNDLAITRALIEGEIPTLESVKPDVSMELARICNKAMAPKPEDRYQTAHEFQNALEAFAEKSGMRVANRDIGKLLTELFEDKRNAMRSLIETQLASLAGGSPDSRAIAFIDPTSSGTPSHLSRTGTKDSYRSVPASSVPMHDSRADSSRGGMEFTQRSLALAPKNGKKQRSKGPWFAFLGIVAVGGAAIWFTRAPGSHAAEKQSAAASSASPSAVAEAPPAPAPAATVMLTISVSPPNAALVLDGKPLAANPFVGSFAKDATVHRLELRADGYEDRAADLRFDQDAKLEFALTRQAAKPATNAARVAPVAADPAPVVRRPKRQIDTSDPWSK